jgi:hypothetical protein
MNYRTAMREHAGRSKNRMLTHGCARIKLADLVE